MCGLAGIFGSLLLLGPGPTQSGIGWGGVFTLAMAVSMHWHIYNEREKLFITGGSLATVLFFTNRFFENHGYKFLE